MNLAPIDYDKLASELVEELQEGYVPPFYAECTTPHQVKQWNNWMVRNQYGRCLDMLLPQPFAEKLATALNKVYHDKGYSVLRGSERG